MMMLELTELPTLSIRVVGCPVGVGPDPLDEVVVPSGQGQVQSPTSDVGVLVTTEASDRSIRAFSIELSGAEKMSLKFFLIETHNIDTQAGVLLLKTYTNYTNFNL